MKRWTKLIILLGLVLMVSSLGLGSRIPQDTLVVGVNTGIFITLDPAAVYEVVPGKYVDAMYAKLVKLVAEEGTIRPAPDLAESWEISEDGLTYTFSIRKDARFSNGDPVTADDVVWSIKRYLEMQSSSVWLLEGIGINSENMDETIELIDDYTLSLTFDAPYASNIVLGILSNQFSGAVNRRMIPDAELASDMGASWLTDNSAGAGAYVLVQWERNNMLVFEANPYYFGEEPALKRLLVKDVPEAASQRLQLERGDIDVAWNLTAQLFEEVVKNPEVYGVVIPGHANEYLAMNTSWGPLQDPKVRLAIKYAINYDEIINDIMLGNALLVQGFVSKGYFGFVEDNPFYQDVEKAKELLTEAGYPNGFEVELMTNDTDTRKAEAEKIQADLALVGIRANIMILPGAQMYPKYRAQGHELVIAGWGNDYPDADNLAQAFANYDAGQLAYRNAWDDRYAVTLCDWGRFESNPDKREQIYKDLTEYWFYNGPFAMLWQSVEYWGVRSELKNFEEAAMGYGMLFDFTKLYK